MLKKQRFLARRKIKDFVEKMIENLDAKCRVNEPNIGNLKWDKKVNILVNMA